MRVRVCALMLIDDEGSQHECDWQISNPKPTTQLHNMFKAQDH